jgi:hypothetical protein
MVVPKYQVDLKPVAGHAIPPLLAQFGAWRSSQEYGSVGWFSLHAERVPVEWDPDRIPRIQRDAFSFLHLPDGSLLLLVNTGDGARPAVALLGSEGDTNSVASSLEEFLILLSNAETGVAGLDEEDASERSKLKAWLRKNKIKPPKAPPFDFDSFLDGTAKAPAPSVPRFGSPLTESLTMLPPFVRQVAVVVGHRVDDGELVEFVTGTLGQSIPNSTTDVSNSKNVVAKKHGLELAFSHDVKNVNYPLVPKSKASYVPYLILVWLNPKLPDPLPFGLEFGMSAEEIAATLGDPAGQIGSLGARRPYWERVLDPTRDIVIRVDQKTFTIQIKQARELTPRWESHPFVGLLVAWLAGQDFLEPSAFPGHEALLEAVRQRKEQGSKLVEAALSRGSWDVHLKDLPGFRHFAFEWIHNIGGKFIRDDLVSVFGSRQGPYGHTEAVLDNDDWQTVDKATPVLDRRFAEWRSDARR